MLKLKAAQEKAEEEAAKATNKEEKAKKQAEAKVSSCRVLGYFAFV